MNAERVNPADRYTPADFYVRLKGRHINKTGLLQLGMVALLVVSVSGLRTWAEEAACLKVIPIPKEEHGYGTFESTVITSQSDLDTFLQKESKG